MPEALEIEEAVAASDAKSDTSNEGLWSNVSDSGNDAGAVGLLDTMQRSSLCSLCAGERKSSNTPLVLAVPQHPRQLKTVPTTVSSKLELQRRVAHLEAENDRLRRLADQCSFWVGDQESSAQNRHSFLSQWDCLAF